jgi:hypothetical protein
MGDALFNMSRRTLISCFITAFIMAVLTITKGNENPAMCYFWNHVPRAFDIITDLSISNEIKIARQRYCNALQDVPRP